MSDRVRCRLSGAMGPSWMSSGERERCPACNAAVRVGVTGRIGRHWDRTVRPFRKGDRVRAKIGAPRVGTIVRRVFTYRQFYVQWDDGTMTAMWADNLNPVMEGSDEERA